MSYARPCEHVSYSARVVRPFVELAKEDLLFPSEQDPDAANNDPRVAIGPAHWLMLRCEQTLGDDLIGLRAGARCAGGDADLLQLLTNTADTLRVALANLTRFLALLGDVWDIRWELSAGRVCVWLGTRVEAPLCAEEFILAVLLRHSVFGSSALRDGARVHLKRPYPKDLAPYRALLGGAELEFDAERNGFTFDAAQLDRPLPGRDRRLFEVLRPVAERTLIALPNSLTLLERVRLVISAQLPTRDLGMNSVAHQLGMTRRTLSRRLSSEGASFQDVVDDVRRARSLELLSRADCSIGQVAALTGFNSRPPFHRAFRRWTEQTPTEYRRERALQS